MSEPPRTWTHPFCTVDIDDASEASSSVLHGDTIKRLISPWLCSEYAAAVALPGNPYRVTHRRWPGTNLCQTNVKKRNHLAATDVYIYIYIIIYRHIISSFSTVQCDCTTCLFRIFRHMRKPSSLQILQLPSHHQPSHLEVTLQYLDVHQI